ncbi:hypothetical protein [Nocardiopsis sp. NPDC057823]|uniref:hypothetical protein n=1 Tax=Nocardiopsis sp. NPDC057823 TaxID=3346256 RepID=UPI0036700F67
MTREQARVAAVELLARRITERDRLPLPDRPDAEPFAASLLAELAGLGYRYVPAVRPVPPTARRAGQDRATPEQVRGYLEHMRRRLPTSDTDETEAL